MKANTFRNAMLAYAALFLALTFPYWMQGEVVAPNRQVAQLAARESINSAENIENKKFGDYANGYIPEITALLRGPRSGWLALWSNQNELGRPLYHSGFSPTYLPSWLITRFTDSPQRFITVLSLGTCFVAGLFVLLLCRELRLSPLAGLLAASSFAASPMFVYWLTFPMFSAVWCWSAGVLYSVTRLSGKPDLLGWSVLAFTAYSLLMTAYPQPVVFHAYIFTGYGAYLTCRHWQSAGRASTVRYLSIVTSAVVVGGTFALPVYLDLAHTASESARVAADPSFFTVVLPKVDSLISAVRFLILSTFPEILGNPISPSYPFPYDGLSITPLVIFLALSGLLLGLRKTWGWWLVIVVFCALAFIHPLYVFGIRYLGFNLSRSNPLGGITLPLTIISAYGADALIRRTQGYGWSTTMVTTTTITFGVLLLAVAVGFGISQGLVVRWWVVVMALAVQGLLAAQIDRTRPAFLVAALVVVGAYISFPLMLRQPPSAIVTTSPLVEAVRSNLPLDSRYAVAAPELVVLPPNLNATLKLASIHSHNSLSSRRYHTLIQALGGEVQTYGRRNRSILPDYGSAVFWMSNIALMLSPTKLEHANLAYLGEVGGVNLHRVISRMGCCLQVTLPPNSMTPDGVQIADPRSLDTHQPAKRVDQGDLLEFDVQNSHASLLILSQKFHQDWHAQVLTSSGWLWAKTVPVNGVFQGVLLPERAQKVRLQFKPFARFGWIANVFWLIVLIVLAYQALCPRVRPPLASDGASAK